MDPAKTVHRKVREAQGELTQRAFARKLGISVGLVARLTTAPENDARENQSRPARYAFAISG
jgi:hypothetical protein